jgi:hypothetical protein
MGVDVGNGIGMISTPHMYVQASMHEGKMCNVGRTSTILHCPASVTVPRNVERLLFRKEGFVYIVAANARSKQGGRSLLQQCLQPAETGLKQHMVQRFRTGHMLVPIVRQHGRSHSYCIMAATGELHSGRRRTT